MSYVSLDLCDGPECPRCGCQDVEILDPPRAESQVRREGWFGPQRRGPRQSSSQPAVKLPQPGGIDESRGNGQWYAAGRAVCKHCRIIFSFRERSGPAVLTVEDAEDRRGEHPPEQQPQTPASVPFYVVACPACESTDTRVTSTQRPIRRHKCRKCGHPFKSVERKG